MDVKTIMVIGSGLMGGGITQVAAQAGYEVIMNDLNMELIDRGFSTIARLLEGQVKKEKLTAAEKDATLARISKSPDLEEAKKADPLAPDRMPDVPRVKGPHLLYRNDENLRTCRRFRKKNIFDLGNAGQL